MTSQIQALAEGSSHRTLDAFAEVLRALAPEICSLSFHDATAETLWLSEDFLLPEDHRLVEDCVASGRQTLSANGDADRPGERTVVAIPLYAADGGIAGAVRMGINLDAADADPADPLELRLAPLLTCLAAELERHRAAPLWRAPDQGEVADIERALRAEQFELYVQPIRSLREENDLTHYEVLLRLRLPDGRLAKPAVFWRTAANLRLLPAIDRWVVRSLLVWLMDNRKRWARVPAVFAVNLSMQSMMDRNFAGYVESCVQKSGLPPQALCFDVAERSASSGHLGVEASIKRLEAMGCEVALDDFGTTASRYGYLRQVPVHYFKIDASLVTAAPRDRVAHALIAAIVHMAGNLGAQTVAESVESDSELQAVRSLGVDYAQGYLLGSPQSLSDYDFRGAATN